MKKILLSLFGLLLLLVPAFAQGEAGSVDAFKTLYAEQSKVVLEGKASELEEVLVQAYAEVTKARKASEDAPDDAEAEKALDAAEAALKKVRNEAKAIAALIDDKSGDSTGLRNALLANGGDVTDMSAGQALGLAAQWFEKVKTWVVEDGPGWVVKIVVFLVILLVFKILANIFGGITRKALSSSKLKFSDLLKRFFVNVVRKIVLLVGLMIALESLGVNTGPLLAGVGVVGFVVGFALQDTLGNFASGIMVLIYRPYDVGDVISAAGETGKVDGMSLVSTTILTPDNQKLIIPNSKIWGGTIRNITAQATRRVDLTIGIGYGDDLDKAQEVLMDVVTAHEKVLEDPAPVVVVTNLGESSVDFAVRPWAKTGDYWDVYCDLTKTIKQRLDKEGISIPFPQRDLHLVRRQTLSFEGPTAQTAR